VEEEEVAEAEEAAGHHQKVSPCVTLSSPPSLTPVRARVMKTGAYKTLPLGSSVDEGAVPLVA
jgi:hypothetical protein